MTRHRNVNLSLQQLAGHLHKLRGKILLQDTLQLSSAKSVFQSVDVSAIKEWLTCTAFLNGVHQRKFLQGNFFSRHMVAASITAEEKTIHLENKFSEKTRLAALSAVKNQVFTNVAANFYQLYEEALQNPVYWRKLIFRLVNQAYLDYGDPDQDRVWLDKLASVTNDDKVTEEIFIKQLTQCVNHFTADLKRYLKLTNLLLLKKEWCNAAFLAHLNTTDFIKAYEVFLSDKNIFKEMKENISLINSDVKSYIEQYELFLMETEAAFISAMFQRAAIKRSGSHYLNPLLYVCDQFTHQQFKFQGLTLPRLMHLDDVKSAENNEKPILIPCHDVISDEQYCYLMQQVTRYVAEQEKRSVNLNTLLQKDVRLVARFHVLANIPLEKSSDKQGHHVPIYPFKMVYDVVSQHEERFIHKLDDVFFSVYQLKKSLAAMQEDMDFFQKELTENQRDWFLKHINCYTLLLELEQLMDEAIIASSPALLEKLHVKNQMLFSTYIANNQEQAVISLLQERFKYYEEKCLAIREKEYRRHVDMLLQQLFQCFYANDLTRFDTLSGLLRAAILNYDAFIQREPALVNKRDVWNIALREAASFYQFFCQEDGVLKNPTPLFLIYQRMEFGNKEQDEKMARFLYHLQQSTPDCLQDDGATIVKLLEANISIDYKLKKSILISQPVVSKKGEHKVYGVPSCLVSLLQGNDLDGRIVFLNDKKSTFIAIDEGFKAADALLNNSYIGFSSDNFNQAMQKVTAALAILHKEKNENIQMNFFDQLFFHKKTWEIKQVWQQQASQYHHALSVQYQNIIKAIKQAFLQELKQGHFNTTLYQSYQDALLMNNTVKDTAMEHGIRDAVLSFPFVLTKAGDIDYQLASNGYLTFVFDYVERQFSKDEQREYYNLLIDKVIQGLIEYQGLIGDKMNYDLFNLSQQKTERTLKLEQMQQVIALLQDKIKAKLIAVDVAHTPLAPYLNEFICNEKARLSESLDNDIVMIMRELLSLDAKFYQHDITALDGILLERKEQYAIIMSAREMAKRVLSQKATEESVQQVLMQFQAERRDLFLTIYNEVLAPHIKYLIDLSYQAELVPGLQYDKALPKEQLYFLLKNNLLLDPVQRNTVFSRLFKLIAQKGTIDFYDRRILQKIAALRLTVDELGVDMSFVIKLLDNVSAYHQADYLPIMLHSVHVTSQAVLKYGCDDSVLTPGQELLFVEHFNHLKSHEFKTYYLGDMVPYSPKLAELIENSSQEMFKEEYRFKYIAELMKVNSVENKKILQNTLDSLSSRHLTLQEYIGSDNVNKLVDLLYAENRSYEASLQQSLLHEHFLPQPSGLHHLAIFNEFMPELSPVFVKEAGCQFGKVINKIKQDLPRLVQIAPLFKSLTVSMLSAKNAMKELANLKVYVDGFMSKTSNESKTAYSSQKVMDYFKAIFSQDDVGTMSSHPQEFSFLSGGGVRQSGDVGLLDQQQFLDKEVFFKYFQMPGLSYLDKIIHDMNDQAVASDEFLILYAIQKNNILQDLFAIDEVSNEKTKEYIDRLKLVKEKADSLLERHCQRLLSLQQLNQEDASNIAEWVQDQLVKIEQDNISNRFDYYYHLVNLYLKNRTMFPVNAQAEIDNVLLRNDQYVKSTLIPMLHPNSPYFLVNADNEDKKGMALKENRELYFQRNAIRAMIYQMRHPNSTEIEIGLSMVKSAYLMRGTSQAESILRFDSINPSRTGSLTFRYNAFEAFLKEPACKLFFGEAISPLLAFLGSYRTQKEGVSPWQDQVMKLSASETLQTRVIALWYAYLYESLFFAVENRFSDDACMIYQKRMRMMFLLLKADKSIVGKAFNELFSKQDTVFHDTDLFFDNVAEINQLSDVYHRLVKITKIILNLPESLTILEQKQLYIIRLLLSTCYGSDRQQYFKLALEELSVLIQTVPPDEAFFNLSIMNKKERSFISMMTSLYFHDKHVGLSFSELAEFLQHTIDKKQADDAIYAKETSMLMVVRAFKEEIFAYFVEYLADVKDVSLLREFLDYPTKIISLTDENANKKFVIAYKMLRDVQIALMDQQFISDHYTAAAQEIVNAITQATISMQEDRVPSRKFSGILDSYMSKFNVYIEKQKVHMASFASH